MRARLRKLLEKWRWERLARKAVRRESEAAGHPVDAAEDTPSRPPGTPPGDDNPG